MFLNILNRQNNLIYNNNISSVKSKKEINFIDNDIINDNNDNPIDIIVNDLQPNAYNYQSNYNNNGEPIDVIVNDLQPYNYQSNYNNNGEPIDVIVNDLQPYNYNNNGEPIDVIVNDILAPKKINVFKTFDKDNKESKCDKDNIESKCDKDNIESKCDKDNIESKCDKDNKCDKENKESKDNIENKCDKVNTESREEKLEELLLFNNQLNNKYFKSLLIITLFGALIFIVNAYTNQEILDIEVYYDRGVTLVWYIIFGFICAILTAHMVYKPYILDSYNNGKKVLYALIFYELAYMYWATTLFKSRVERGLALVASVFLVAATIWLGWVCYHYDNNTIYIFIIILLFSLYLQVFTIYVAHAPWKQIIGDISNI